MGTIQTSRVGILSEIKELSNRELLSNEVYWEENGKTILGSYVVKTFKGKKNVLMLSTMESILVVTIDDQKFKPQMYKLYDFTKGGTDIIDQKMGTYTTKSKSQKWSRVAFSYLLDTIRVNSSTLIELNKNHDPKLANSFNFGYELATQLVMPLILRRSRNGLSSEVVKKITSFAGEQFVEMSENIEHSKFRETPTRCRQCIINCYGEDQKINKNKIKKIKTACQSCSDAFCNEHLVFICQKCYTKIKK